MHKPLSVCHQHTLVFMLRILGLEPTELYFWYLPHRLSVTAHPYACVVNVSSPVCGVQKLNVSCDHPEVRREDGGWRWKCFGFELITMSGLVHEVNHAWKMSDNFKWNAINPNKNFNILITEIMDSNHIKAFVIHFYLPQIWLTLKQLLGPNTTTGPLLFLWGCKHPHFIINSTNPINITEFLARLKTVSKT